MTNCKSPTPISSESPSSTRPMLITGSLRPSVLQVHPASSRLCTTSSSLMLSESLLVLQRHQSLMIEKELQLEMSRLMP